MHGRVSTAPGGHRTRAEYPRAENLRSEYPRAEHPRAERLRSEHPRAERHACCGPLGGAVQEGVRRHHPRDCDGGSQSPGRRHGGLRVRIKARVKVRGKVRVRDKVINVRVRVRRL